MKLINQLLSLLKPPTLDEVIVHETEKEQKEVMACDHVILTHEFQKHMAKAKIKAMEEWNHRNDSSTPITMDAYMSKFKHD